MTVQKQDYIPAGACDDSCNTEDYTYASLKISKEDIEKYINKVKESGCVADTVHLYRTNLYRLYDYLDEDKCITPDAVEGWKQSLQQEGYVVRTVNTFMAILNGFLDFMGHRELQTKRIKDAGTGTAQPELTREEYLRLLSTARILRKERVYLLIKAMATTGITVGEMERLTAEAVEEGQIKVDSGVLRIPESLRDELKHFMTEKGITTGPVFQTKTGKPQDRTSLSVLVKSISKEARVPEEKANPRCLRKLYLNTKNEIHDNLARMAEQEYDRLLAAEQSVIGWWQ